MVATYCHKVVNLTYIYTFSFCLLIFHPFPPVLRHWQRWFSRLCTKRQRFALSPPFCCLFASQRSFCGRQGLVKPVKVSFWSILSSSIMTSYQVHVDAGYNTVPRCLGRVETGHVDTPGRDGNVASQGTMHWQMFRSCEPWLQMKFELSKVEYCIGVIDYWILYKDIYIYKGY